MNKDLYDELEDIKDALGWKNFDDKDINEFIIGEIMKLIEVLQSRIEKR